MKKSVYTAFTVLIEIAFAIAIYELYRMHLESMEEKFDSYASSLKDVVKERKSEAWDSRSD